MKTETGMKMIYTPIIEAIFQVSGYTLDDLGCRSRRYPLVLFRKIFCLLCNEEGMNIGSIGDLINRDHSTVICALKSFNAGEKFDPALFRLLDKVKSKMHDFA